MNYIDKLINDCNRAKEAKPTSETVITSLSQISELNGVKNAIYIIELVEGDVVKVFDDFKRFKTSKARACAKVNSPSKVLYVGSSTSDIKYRLKQHLNQASKGTYALHMVHWFTGKCKVTVKGYDEPIEVIQIIEDSISHDLKPAFGKKGSNNK